MRVVGRHFRFEGLRGRAFAFLVLVADDAGCLGCLLRGALMPFAERLQGCETQADEEGHAADGAACDGCCRGAAMAG